MRRKFLSNGMERGEERTLFVSSTELVINRYFAFSDIAWQSIIRFNAFLDTCVIPKSKLFRSTSLFHVYRSVNTLYRNSLINIFVLTSLNDFTILRFSVFLLFLNIRRFRNFPRNPAFLAILLVRLSVRVHWKVIEASDPFHLPSSIFSNMVINLWHRGCFYRAY